MSTRQGSPEPLGTGENRGPLNLGTSTPQGNHTFFGLAWQAKKLLLATSKFRENPSTASQWYIDKPCWGFLGHTIFKHKF